MSVRESDKRIKRKTKKRIREAEERVSRLIVKRMEELRTEEPREPTPREQQLFNNIMNQLTNRNKEQ